MIEPMEAEVLQLSIHADTLRFEMVERIVNALLREFPVLTKDAAVLVSVVLDAIEPPAGRPSL